MDARVVQAEDDAQGQPAVLTPIHLYKGPRQERYTMARQGGHIVTESYQGFGESVGTEMFIILYGKDGAYYFQPCESYLGDQPAIRKKLLGYLQR